MKALPLALFVLIASSPAFSQGPAPTGPGAITLRAGQTRMVIQPDGLRFGFFAGSREIAAAHPAAGIEINGAALNTVTAAHCSESQCSFTAKSSNGAPVEVTIALSRHHCEMKIDAPAGTSVVVRTAGLSPSYGLADRAAIGGRDNTDLTGIVDDHLLSGAGFSRLASNFVIFPKQGMAEVLPWPRIKIVHLTQDENAQGVASADGPVTAHYFFGTPREIYAEFATVRRDSGYPLLMPKYAMFGVGWEAFGALGWNTNEQTDRESVDRYLALGYPLKWIVIGSGFWPAEPADMHETTSFGLWDKTRYPDPAKLVQHFHNEGLKVLLGLRITFITTGPFAAAGVKKGYFIEENGQPKVFKTGWPALPCYLLNAQMPGAVDWYLGLVAKWKAYGIDGFKEDFYGFGKYNLRDDKVDPINLRLMQLGYDLIERNGYLASNGDLQRINDFNYNQDQDRGPVNALALAYSGLPLVYPDIVGGTFGEKRFSTAESSRLDMYMMRNAQWAALHSSMSMGQPPWSFQDPQVGAVMLKAAQTHERLRPYIYSQAVRFIHDGYPWTMTPLPIAFPSDAQVYGRGNRETRGYEWMIGDALLAAPLYGDDYATAGTRDIYLPRGKWMDYETGQVETGPTLLKNYALPVDKTPLFVGGTGIVFEQGAHAVVARIYPIARNARTEFWSSDAKTRSTVELKVGDWNRIRITDTTTHHTVHWKLSRFADEFTLAPGHSYLVE
ncbi:MAG TPA: TIM-barrel domain-containing protein [Terracidiphilus sp.]|nr:TIM-barrel domain-containing protein [Terracidiphilus sp.]